MQKPSLAPVSLQPRTTPGQVCNAEVGVQPQHLVKVPDGALIVAQLCRGNAWHIWQYAIITLRLCDARHADNKHGGKWPKHAPRLKRTPLEGAADLNCWIARCMSPALYAPTPCRGKRSARHDASQKILSLSVFEGARVPQVYTGSGLFKTSTHARHHVKGICPWRVNTLTSRQCCRDASAIFPKCLQNRSADDA